MHDVVPQMRHPLRFAPAGYCQVMGTRARVSRIVGIGERRPATMVSKILARVHAKSKGVCINRLFPSASKALDVTRVLPTFPGRPHAYTFSSRSATRTCATLEVNCAADWLCAPVSPHLTHSSWSAHNIHVSQRACTLAHARACA